MHENPLGSFEAPSLLSNNDSTILSWIILIGLESFYRVAFDPPHCGTLKNHFDWSNESRIGRKKERKKKEDQEKEEDQEQEKNLSSSSSSRFVPGINGAAPRSSSSPAAPPNRAARTGECRSPSTAMAPLLSGGLSGLSATFCSAASGFDGG